MLSVVQNKAIGGESGVHLLDLQWIKYDFPHFDWTPICLSLDRSGN